MRISTRDSGGVVVLGIEGKVTIESDPGRIHEAVRQALERGNTGVLINLAGVGFIDSVGVGTLVACYTTALSRGSYLAFSNASENVLQVLNTTNLLRVFEVFRDESLGMARLTRLT